MLGIARIKTAKKHLGKNLHRRLDYARYLLTQTNEPLEKVTINCGWANERAFAADFQKEVGVTPEQYRRWHQS